MRFAVSLSARFPIELFERKAYHIRIAEAAQACGVAKQACEKRNHWSMPCANVTIRKYKCYQT
jgi:hypothetical protein